MGRNEPATVTSLVTPVQKEAGRSEAAWGEPENRESKCSWPWGSTAGRQTRGPWPAQHQGWEGALGTFCTGGAAGTPNLANQCSRAPCQDGAQGDAVGGGIVTEPTGDVQTQEGQVQVWCASGTSQGAPARTLGLGFDLTNTTEEVSLLS